MALTAYFPYLYFQFAFFTPLLWGDRKPLSLKGERLTEWHSITAICHLRAYARSCVILSYVPITPVPVTLCLYLNWSRISTTCPWCSISPFRSKGLHWHRTSWCEILKSHIWSRWVIQHYHQSLLGKSQLPHLTLMSFPVSTAQKPTRLEWEITV